MNYIGSKKSLLPFLEEAVKLCQTDNENPIFCDLFSGTGIVGRHFKKKGFSIIANDIEDYSFSLISHYIKNNNKINIEKELQILNQIKGIDNGFIFNNYCPLGKESKVLRKKGQEKEEINRMYFTNENGKIIDEARQLIEDWKRANKINEEQFRYLLAVIIEATDKVANTASVYGAFLKKFKKTALKKIEFLPLEYAITEQTHEAYKCDANKLISKIEGDILYLDPPYNERQYGANYHVLNTVAKYDNPKIKGVTGMREYNTSHWCKKSKVKEEFEFLIKNAKFKYILLSYNSESLMSPDEIKEIMKENGEYSFITKDYGRFKADKTGNNRNYKSDKVLEYIHILKKVV